MQCEVFPFRVKLRNPLTVKQASLRFRDGYLISLTSDDITGWGEASPLPAWSRVGISEVGEELRRAKEKINSSDFRGFDEGIDGLVYTSYGHAGLTGAWADMRAQQSGRPLVDDLLHRQGLQSVSLENGAKHEHESDLTAPASATVGASIENSTKHEAGRGVFDDCKSARVVRVNALISAVELSEVEKQADAAVNAGFDTVKLKVGFKAPDIDVQRAKVARSALGVKPELRLDANQSWQSDTAVYVLSNVQSCDISFCEDPVSTSPCGMSSIAEVEKASGVRTAVDEPIRSVADVEAAVAAGVRMIVVKPQALGGPEKALKIIKRAYNAGADVVVTSFMDTAIGVTHAFHIAAAADQLARYSGMSLLAHGIATGSLIVGDVAPPLPVESGFIRVPGVVGLGVVAHEPVG